MDLSKTRYLVKIAIFRLYSTPNLKQFHSFSKVDWDVLLETSIYIYIYIISKWVVTTLMLEL